MKKTFLRKLIKFSHYSTCLTLPKSATESLGWNAGTELEIKLDLKRNRLLIVQPNNIESNLQNKVPSPITFTLSDEKSATPLVTPDDTKKLNQKNSKDDDLLPLEEL